MTHEPLLLTLDVGSQSVRAALFTPQGDVRRLVQHPLEPPDQPAPGWAEKDAEYFFATVCAACRELADADAAGVAGIGAIALTGQRASLVVVDRDGPAQLLVNDAPSRGGWIMLQVLERSGGDALGAWLELEIGEARVRRDVRAAFGYLSSHDPRVHHGLGDAERVDSVEVTWSDGERERFGPLSAGTTHTLRRGQGSPP